MRIRNALISFAGVGMVVGESVINPLNVAKLMP